MELSITLGSYMISQVATTYVAAVNTNGQSPTQKKLDVLYNEIAKDLKNGKPLVISDTVVLWEEGRSVWWGDGENPERNLYWGAKYGLYTMLKQSHEWKEVYRQGPNDNGEITSVVFERDCPTNNFWRSKGVLKPFKTYLVIKAFKASDINKAYELTAKNIFTGNPDQIKLPNGQIIEAGGKSHLIIHSGHMISEGNLPLEQHKSQLSPTKTKGVAFLTCLSKSVFSGNIDKPDVVGLLYTNNLFAPEGYTHLPFYDSIINGDTAKNIIDNNNRKYKFFHKSSFGMFSNED